MFTAASRLPVCLCWFVVAICGDAKEGQDYPTRPAASWFQQLRAQLRCTRPILAQGLSERWPHRMIVDIDQALVATSVPGRSPRPIQTVHVADLNDSLLINPWLFKEVPFDPRKDFTPISLSMYSPNVLAAHPSAGIKSFDEFLKALAPHRQAQLRFAW